MSEESTPVHIASCSFGKDSLAAILVRLEHGEPVDAALYCRIMFDDDISAEYPEHDEWIHTYAIPLLKSRYGIETHIAQATGEYDTYCKLFYRTRGATAKWKGVIYGFPLMTGSWCNSKLKVRSLKVAESAFEEPKIILGIAVDEPKRIPRAVKKGQVLPLVDYGITEAQAFDICRKADLLSPAYISGGGKQRLGCWFCHKQRIGEYRKLRAYYPQLWQKLLALDKDNPPGVGFTKVDTVHNLDDRFANEEAQYALF